MYPKTKSIQKRLESEKECYWMCLCPDAKFINYIDFNVYEKNIGKWCLKLLKENTIKKTFGVWRKRQYQGIRWVEIFTKEQVASMQAAIDERKENRKKHKKDN